MPLGTTGPSMAYDRGTEGKGFEGELLSVLVALCFFSNLHYRATRDQGPPLDFALVCGSGRGQGYGLAAKALMAARLEQGLYCDSKEV